MQSSCVQMTIAKTYPRLRGFPTGACNTSRDVCCGLPWIQLPYGKLNLSAVRSGLRDSRRHGSDSGGMKKEQSGRNEKGRRAWIAPRMPRTRSVRHKRRRYDQKWWNQSVTTCPVFHAVASHALYASDQCIRIHTSRASRRRSHSVDGLFR